MQYNRENAKLNAKSVHKSNTNDDTRTIDKFPTTRFSYNVWIIS